MSIAGRGSGSPAIDRIPTGTAGLCYGTTTPDQRGTARPVGAGCDVGATEGGNPTGTPGAWTVDTALDGIDADPGDGVCDAGAGACTLRAAIDEANRHALPDTITIGAGIDPVVSIAGIDDDANDSGDLDATTATSGAPRSGVLTPVIVFSLQEPKTGTM